MNSMLKDLANSAKHALALAGRTASTYSMKSKSSFLKAVQATMSTAKVIASAPMAVRIGAFTWALTNFAYTGIVAYVGGFIQGVVELALMGAKAVTKILATPFVLAYRGINAVQRLITRKSLPTVDVYGKINSAFKAVDNYVNKQFVESINLIMHWYVRFAFHIASAVSLAFVILAGMPLVYVAPIIAGAILGAMFIVEWNDPLRESDAPTFADVKYTIGYVWSSIAGVFSNGRVRRLQEENETLRVELDEAITIAQDFKRAFEMSRKPGKKGGPRLASS
jgi:hypothetical protein